MPHVQVNKLAKRRPDELNKLIASTNMLQLFKLCYEAESDELRLSEARAYDADVGDWIQKHATNDVLQQFFINKLRLLSPCEDSFWQLSRVPGFLCAHLIDLADPGDVLLQYWQPDQREWGMQEEEHPS